MCHSALAIGSTNLLFDAVENLPASFRIVKHCGNWRHAQQEGYYRLIVGDVYGGAGSEVYVQLMTNPEQDAPSKVIKTLSFPELNNDHSQYYFSSADCSKVKEITYVNLKGTYEHDEVEKTHYISIKLIDMDHYQITEKIK